MAAPVDTVVLHIEGGQHGPTLRHLRRAQGTVPVGRSSSRATGLGAPGPTNAQFLSPVMSKQHAEFTWTAEGVHVTDLDSTHGTWVTAPGGGRDPEMIPKLTPTQLAEGMTLTFGTVRREQATECMHYPVRVRIGFACGRRSSTGTYGPPAVDEEHELSESGDEGAPEEVDQGDVLLMGPSAAAAEPRPSCLQRVYGNSGFNEVDFKDEGLVTAVSASPDSLYDFRSPSGFAAEEDPPVPQSEDPFWSNPHDDGASVPCGDDGDAGSESGVMSVPLEASVGPYTPASEEGGSLIPASWNSNQGFGQPQSQHPYGATIVPSLSDEDEDGEGRHESHDRAFDIICISSASDNSPRPEAPSEPEIVELEPHDRALSPFTPPAMPHFLPDPPSIVGFEPAGFEPWRQHHQPFEARWFDPFHQPKSPVDDQAEQSISEDEPVAGPRQAAFCDEDFEAEEGSDCENAGLSRGFAPAGFSPFEFSDGAPAERDRTRTDSDAVQAAAILAAARERKRQADLDRASDLDAELAESRRVEQTPHLVEAVGSPGWTGGEELMPWKQGIDREPSADPEESPGSLPFGSAGAEDGPGAQTNEGMDAGPRLGDDRTSPVADASPADRSGQPHVPVAQKRSHAEAFPDDPPATDKHPTPAPSDRVTSVQCPSPSSKVPCGSCGRSFKKRHLAAILAGYTGLIGVGIALLNEAGANMDAP